VLHGEEIQVELFLRQLCGECLEWHMPPTTSPPAQGAITDHTRYCCTGVIINTLARTYNQSTLFVIL